MDPEPRPEENLLTTAVGAEEGKGFLDHYLEEVKDQFKGGSSGKK